MMLPRPCGMIYLAELGQHGLCLGEWSIFLSAGEVLCMSQEYKRWSAYAFCGAFGAGKGRERTRYAHWRSSKASFSANWLPVQQLQILMGLMFMTSLYLFLLFNKVFFLEYIQYTRITPADISKNFTHQNKIKLTKISEVIASAT